MKSKWMIPLLVGMAMLVGCGEKEQKEQSGSQEASAPSIKVTKNVVRTDVKEGPSKSNSGQFYYSYNKEKNESDYNSEGTKTRTTIDAYLNIKSPYEKVRITLMIKRLSKEYIIKCSPCHDDYANGVIMDFKTGKKKNALMRELVSQIEDTKLRQMADEIANFNREIRKMRRGK
ncbi:MAG: hypothetical protein B6D59_07430 [Campylobacteraceae bacterium 4484_4]|nr:MAG: hypothetical protein B6D59_07430 [Campylobacteraceae bacterium 4484_4]